MEISLSADAQSILQKQVARDGFASAEAAIEEAIRFYESHRPTPESFLEKLREAHESFEAGDVAPLDADDIKRRGRDRLAAKEAAK